MPYTINIANPTGDAGLKEFEEFISARSYVDGAQASAGDSAVFKAVGSAPDAKKYPNANRWYNHIASFKNKDSLPGVNRIVLGGASAAPAAAPAAKPAAPAAKPAADDDDEDFFAEDNDADAAWEAELEKRAKAAQARIDERNAAKGVALVAKSSVVIDVKPWDDETDLAAMEKAVRAVEKEGLLWGASKLIPVAYGLKKLQIMATVVDDLVSMDEVEEEIRANEDLVQSTDIVSFNKL